MDAHVSSWILEYILRQQLDDWVTFIFISILPPSDSNLRLKKTILLRRISSLLSNFSFSESILKTLEIIEEIDHCSGTKSLSSMKKAYSSVAVECAAKFLRQEPEDYGSFADAVNRVWKGRIGAMRAWRGGVGFVSDELRDLEREMLAAVENPSFRRKLRDRDTRKDALESLAAFLKEAVEEMGPPFLKLAAETIYLFGKEGDMMNWKDGRASKRPVTDLSQDDVDASERCNFEGAKKKSKLSSKDMRKGSLIPSEKDASDRAIISQKDQGIATLEEVGSERVQNKYHTLPSPEVAKVQEALKSSSAELHAVVQDPLPDALELAAGVLCNTGQKNQKQPENNQSRLDADGLNSVEKGIDGGCVGHKNQKQPENNQSRIDADGHNSVGKGIDDSCVGQKNQEQPESNHSRLDADGHNSAGKGIDDGRAGQKNQKQPESNQSRLDADGHNSAGKGIDDGCVGETGNGKEDNGKRDGSSWPGFMEWNRTARTYEWNDSIDSPPEEPPKVARKLRLPTPEKRMVSPLKKYEATRFTRRRRIKRWSPEEEQTLREAVQKYGKGNWKIILEMYPAVFEERTTIDLKDKWRNMVRGSY